MFGFTLTLNLNLHSGSGSVVWLNQTSNIMFGSGSNNVREVRNRTAASLSIIVGALKGLTVNRQLKHHLLDVQKMVGANLEKVGNPSRPSKKDHWRGGDQNVKLN